MEYAVESNSETSRKFIDALMPSFIKELGLQNSRKAVLVKVTNDMLEGMEGATMNIEIADCYLVLLKPPRRNTKSNFIHLATTLAHEMVHVRQLAKGQMRFLPNESKIWMGKRYTKRTKYLDQPWEIDAFSRQELLVRRVFE